MIFDGFTREEISPKPVAKGCLYICDRVELDTCPVCGILKDEDVAGKLCGDCCSNSRLKDEWEWYKMLRHMKANGKIFLVAYWLLIFFGSAFGITDIFTSLFLIGMWYFNVWYFRHNDYDKRLSDQKEKMFLMKLRGNDE